MAPPTMRLYLYNDYAGSTQATARDVGTSWGQGTDRFNPYNATGFSDYLDYRDNVDYVKFNMEAPGTISLRMKDFTYTGGLTASMELEDSDGNVLASTSGTVGSGLNVDRYTLNTGTYYVKYTQISGSDPYVIRIVSDYAGDTTATARNLGDITNSSRQDYDMVGALSGLPTYGDPLDLYKFTLSKTSPLDIRLTIAPTFTPPTFDASLQLAQDTNGDGFIESNEIISQSANTGDDSLSTTLNAGTYYAVVVQNGAYTSYQLDFDSDFDAVKGDPKAYSNLSKATVVAPFNGETYQNGGFGISAGDFTDFYKFTMAANGNFLSSVFDNPFYSRTSYVPSLSIIKDSNNNGRADVGETVGTVSSTGVINQNLAAGTYFLEVAGDGEQASYYLRMVPDYAGNTLSAARPFSPISGAGPATQTFNDYIEQDFGPPSDVDDFYKFVLTSPYTVTLKTTGVAGEDLSLALIQDKNNNGTVDPGDIITQSQVVDSPFETITQTLNPGTYYVRVEGVNGGTNYALSAAFTGGVVSSDPDNTFAKVDAGTSNKKALGQFFDGTLAPANDVDLVRFTVAAGQKASFDVDSSGGSNLDTALRLFDSNGVQLATNNDGAAPGEIASKFSYLEYTFATAGNYYIGVSLNPNTHYDPLTGGGAVNGGTTAPYRLTLNNLGTTALPTILRVNAGGTSFVDSNGNFFESDASFNGGSPSNTAFPVAGTTDDYLYYSYRHGTNINFDRAVANGTYKLSLYFADSSSTAPGQRTFDVTAEGKKILSNFDIYAAAGAPRTAVVKTFTVTVTDGQFDLHLGSLIGSADISAISLVKQ